jgi:hypothetical protein
MRCPQVATASGSLKWLRVTIEGAPYLLEAALPLAAGETVHWLSPLRVDDWSEYRDGAFLERLEVGHFHSELARFWPTRGPQWDGLARTSRDALVLVEAKAHVAELFSQCTATAAESKGLIHRSLAATKRHYGVPAHYHWTYPFYQYGNRLAHLYWLREVCGLNAHLLFVYFLNDQGAGHRPTQAAEWRSALTVMRECLGLTGRTPRVAVHNVFIDVTHLQQHTHEPLPGLGSSAAPGGP